MEFWFPSLLLWWNNQPDISNYINNDNNYKINNTNNGYNKSINNTNNRYNNNINKTS